MSDKPKKYADALAYDSGYDAGYAKGKEDAEKRYDAILIKLKENMELAGHVEGWDKPFCEVVPYRQGQFSVYEWLKRELGR